MTTQPVVGMKVHYRKYRRDDLKRCVVATVTGDSVAAYERGWLWNKDAWWVPSILERDGWLLLEGEGVDVPCAPVEGEEIMGARWHMAKDCRQWKGSGKTGKNYGIV